MRALVLVGAAVLVTGCVGSKERVTLLDPAFSANSWMSKSGVVVIDPDGAAVELNRANNQARLCGDNCTPRIRDLGGPRKEYSTIMRHLPREEVRREIMFAENSSTISSEQIEYLKKLVEDDGVRPGRQIIVRGFTDTEGDPTSNMELSRLRAESVVAQLTAAGFSGDEIEPEWDGERTALTKGPDGTENPAFRKVEIVIR